MDYTSFRNFHQKYSTHRQRVETATSFYSTQANDWSQYKKRLQADRELRLEKTQKDQDQQYQRFKAGLAWADLHRNTSLPPISPRQEGLATQNLDIRRAQANRIDKDNQFIVERLIQAGPLVRTARELENSYQRHAALVDKMSRLKRSIHDIDNFNSSMQPSPPPKRWRSGGRPAPRRNLSLKSPAKPMKTDSSPARKSDSCEGADTEADRVRAHAAALQYMDLLMGRVKVNIRREACTAARQYLDILMDVVLRNVAQPEQEANSSVDDETIREEEADEDQCSEEDRYSEDQFESEDHYSQDEDFESDCEEEDEQSEYDCEGDEQADENSTEVAEMKSSAQCRADEVKSQTLALHVEGAADDELLTAQQEVEDQDSKPSSAAYTVNSPQAGRSHGSNFAGRGLSNGFDRGAPNGNLNHREDDSGHGSSNTNTDTNAKWQVDVVLSQTGQLNISFS